MREYIITIGDDNKMRKELLDIDAAACFGHPHPLKEEIVRCEDCRYYGCYDGSMWCSRTYEQVPGGTCDYQTVEPDGFCAWGERRTNQ